MKEFLTIKHVIWIIGRSKLALLILQLTLKAEQKGRGRTEEEEGLDGLYINFGQSLSHKHEKVKVL